MTYEEYVSNHLSARVSANFRECQRNLSALCSGVTIKGGGENDE